jgi:hypothetical protein
MQIRYKFVAGLKPLAPINPAEMPSVSPQDITKEFILEKKAQPAIDRTLPVAKPSFANTPEDIALKNIVDLFSGQVISLDEETTDSSDN